LADARLRAPELAAAGEQQRVRAQGLAVCIDRTYTAVCKGFLSKIMQRIFRIIAKNKQAIILQRQNLFVSSTFRTMEAENAEYIGFITDVFYKDVESFLECLVLSDSNDSTVLKKTQKVRDNVVSLERMFRDKTMQIEQTLRILRQTQRERKDLEDEVDKLKKELEKKASEEVATIQMQEQPPVEGEGDMHLEMSCEQFESLPASWPMLSGFTQSFQLESEGIPQANKALKRAHKEVSDTLEKLTSLYTQYFESQGIAIPSFGDVQIRKDFY
jgi:hypothetical protein